MPYESDKQRHLMEGIAHGWHPTGMKDPPSRAVAQEFHNAEQREHKHRQIAEAMMRRP